MGSSPVWHAVPAEQVLETLGTDPTRGLSTQEAAARLERAGPNSLQEKRKKPAWLLFLSQFNDFMALVLLGATALSGLLGDVADALTIIAIVILNAYLGFIQQYRAEKSLAALRDLAAPVARVLRGGEEATIPAAGVVPGDILLLEAGDRVAADARILEATRAEAEEAALTGESVPVRKAAGILRPEAQVGERRNMLFAGTTVTRGRIKAAVVATGMHTEVGRIAGLIQEADEGLTPLQQRLEDLGKKLVWGCLAICAVVAGLGVAQGEPPYLMILSGVSLAVAAIPEGLPAVVTICLALGVQRMSKRNVIIRRLPAVETLGCATVICADKTGTITRNEMTVRRIWVPGREWEDDGRPEQGEDERLQRVLLAAVLCNDARLVPERGAGNAGGHRVEGDPTEGALLAAGARRGLWRERLELQWPRVAEIPFEPERRCMTVICRPPRGRPVAFVKGAPDTIVAMSSRIWTGQGAVPLDAARRREILARNEDYGRRALRVLAVASRELPTVPAEIGPEQIERDLTFLGLLAMADPPRPEARRAVGTCRRAGIRTVMITGDHPTTARAVAEEVGILAPGDEVLTGAQVEVADDEELRRLAPHVTVYARASAAHKLRVVRALKSRGQVVAMTGDGVNDAPALKEADIGVAMGLTGTEVTREASAMVLQDDNFASLVAAVAEGRSIYDNIRKFVRYLLSCNVGEVLVMLGATLARLPLPLLPIQMLWVNLVTDGLPALALGVEPAEGDVMNRPPRAPRESIFAHGLLGRIFGRGCLIGAATLGVFLAALYLPLEKGGAGGDLEGARTMAFACLVVAQLVYAFHCRTEKHHFFEVDVSRSPALVGAVLVSSIMLLMVIYLPFLTPLFHTVPLSWRQWGLTLAGALAGDVFVTLRYLLLPRAR